MSKQGTAKLNRREILNAGATALLGLALPAGLREEFSIQAEHDSKPKQGYPLTDTVIRTKSGNELRIIGVLHTPRGLRRSKEHLQEAVKNSDIVLTENTELVGVELEYFNALAKYSKQQGKEVIDIDRHSKAFTRCISLAYVGSISLNVGCVALARHGDKADKPKLIRTAQASQALLLGTAFGALLMSELSPIRNYGPKDWDISFKTTARSIAMYCNALRIADQSEGKRVTVFCGEGHARDMTEFHSKNDDKSNSRLLKLYQMFLEEPVNFDSSN
jgi:hypothetical protein